MKKKIIFIILIVLLLIGISLIFILKEEKSDSEKFSSEYTKVEEDNVFVYRDSKEIINVLKYGTGIVYLGFPECPWCQAYVKYLNEVAKEVGIDTIYYYNIYEDRENNSSDYQEMVKVLSDYLEYDEEGNKRIYVPNVSFIVNGDIIGNDNETSVDTKGIEKPEEYWTEEEVTELKSNLKEYMLKVKDGIDKCTDCNK